LGGNVVGSLEGAGVVGTAVGLAVAGGWLEVGRCESEMAYTAGPSADPTVANIWIITRVGPAVLMGTSLTREF